MKIRILFGLLAGTAMGRTRNCAKSGLVRVIGVPVLVRTTPGLGWSGGGPVGKAAFVN